MILRLTEVDADSRSFDPFCFRTFLILLFRFVFERVSRTSKGVEVGKWSGDLLAGEFVDRALVSLSRGLIAKVCSMLEGKRP